uniref:Kinetochore protein Ndc80 n=1 Tax=Hirondellea gigas TaxID=1518452 RepID=A0A2P2IBX1_9CRUS
MASQHPDGNSVCTRQPSDMSQFELPSHISPEHKRLPSGAELSIIYNGIRFKAIPIQAIQSDGSSKKKRNRGDHHVSHPSNVQHVLHVEWNEKLQAYTGIPDVWTQDIPQSALRFSTRQLPSHINPRFRLESETEFGDSAEPKKKSKSCLPSKTEFPSWRRRLSIDDYKAEYLASVDVEYEREKVVVSELPGNAPGPRVFPGPRVHFQQPYFRNNNSILKVSVRNYLEKLGFTDLDKEYRVENLREILLDRLRLGPERVTQDTLARLPYSMKRMIFSFLDVKSLLRACSTASEMAALLDEPSLWRPYVTRMHTEQGFLHSAYPARHRGWKVSYRAMTRIVSDPSYCDSIWNVVVQGDVRIGKNRLVYTLGDALLRRNREHSTKDIRDDPAIDAVTGIYRFRIDFVTRRVVIEDKIIKLQVWDGGLVLGDSAVFGAAHIVLLLLDLTDETSFNRLPKLLRDTFRATKSADPNLRIVLVGNTRGSGDHRTVSFDRAKRFANERGLVYLEANIDNPNEVDEAFVKLTEEFADSHSLVQMAIHRAKNPKQCVVM